MRTDEFLEDLDDTEEEDGNNCGIGEGHNFWRSCSQISIMASSNSLFLLGFSDNSSKGVRSWLSCINNACGKVSHNVNTISTSGLSLERTR